MPHASLRALALLIIASPLGAQNPPPAEAPPQDAIPRHETLTIDSRLLGESRTINVYTPPGYDGAATFPVLYMPDGGLAEDFPHVVNTIDSLITLKQVPPMIVVGIENTQRRRDLTGPTTVASDSTIAPRVGGSAAFRSFIRDELMPVIRTRYRCTAQTAIVGESLAGLFIVETFLVEPTLFERYIALSPSMWWNGGELVQSAKERLSGVAGLKRTVYLTAANEPGIEKETATLAATIKEVAPAGLTWYYEPRPDLEHSTIFRGMAPVAFRKALN